MSLATPSLTIHRVNHGGPTTAFLHGLLGRGKNFAGTAQAVGVDALLVDAPNHAASPWTAHFSYREMADLTAAAIRAHATTPVHVVGHSMGGKTAMVLALRHPEVVQSLTVVDIAPARSEPGSFFPRLFSALESLDLSAVRSRAEADAKLAESVPDATIRSFVLQNLTREGADGGASFRFQANLSLLARELDTVMGFPELDGTFDGPTLWVRGGNSPYCEPGHLLAMERLFPDTVPVTVENAGHWVHADQPRAFARLLTEFLAETRRTDDPRRRR